MGGPQLRQQLPAESLRLAETPGALPTRSRMHHVAMLACALIGASRGHRAVAQAVPCACQARGRLELGSGSIQEELRCVLGGGNRLTMGAEAIGGSGENAGLAARKQHDGPQRLLVLGVVQRRLRRGD